MTRHSSFKKAVRRHAEDTGQRYTEALVDLEGIGERIFHKPDSERLLGHLRDRYHVDPIAANQVSRHNNNVLKIDLRDGDSWIARVYPPSRPRVGVEGDAAILRFLEEQDYPAERLAADEAVSEFDGSSMLVTRFLECEPLPGGSESLAMMGDLMGRLHALPPNDAVSRPGGASGDDATRQGSPRQDLLAALSFLDAVDSKVPDENRAEFEQLRDQVRNTDDGTGLPEGLLHGNLLNNPDHAVLTKDGPVAINWKAAGIGPRLADFAYLMWGAPWTPGGGGVEAAVNAYRQHIEPTDEELDRLEAVMYIRPLYLTCFGYRRNLLEGKDENVLAFIDPEHMHNAAEATRAAFRQ
jgi:Ser/Thr protein kinase RdoA (MazF antagonist)